MSTRKVSRDTCFCGDVGVLVAAWAFDDDRDGTVPCPFCWRYWEEERVPDAGPVQGRD